MIDLHCHGWKYEIDGLTIKKLIHLKDKSMSYNMLEFDIQIKDPKVFKDTVITVDNISYYVTKLGVISKSKDQWRLELKAKEV